MYAKGPTYFDICQYWELFCEEYIPEEAAKNRKHRERLGVCETEEKTQPVCTPNNKHKSIAYVNVVPEGSKFPSAIGTEQVNRVHRNYILAQISNCDEMLELEKEYKDNNVDFNKEQFAYLCFRLCRYIAGYRYVRLKPSIEDTAAKVDKLTNLLGSTNAQLLKIVKEAIVANKHHNVYEIEDIISMAGAKKSRGKRETQPYAAKFCNALTVFMRKHIPHPIRRIYRNKANANSNEKSLTPTEQSALMQIMCIVGYTHYKNNNTAYRKLLEKKEPLNNGVAMNIPYLGEHCVIVKYSEWSKDTYKSILQVGDDIYREQDNGGDEKIKKFETHFIVESISEDGNPTFRTELRIPMKSKDGQMTYGVIEMDEKR